MTCLCSTTMFKHAQAKFIPELEHKKTKESHLNIKVRNGKFCTDFYDKIEGYL